jgi:hypothetical protein
MKLLHSLCLSLCVAVLVLAGCALTPAALERSDQITAYGTNLIAASAPTVATVVPPPWNALASGALALANAALVAWNANLHRKASQK